MRDQRVVIELSSCRLCTLQRECAESRSRIAAVSSVHTLEAVRGPGAASHRRIVVVSSVHTPDGVRGQRVVVTSSVHIPEGMRGESSSNRRRVVVSFRAHLEEVRGSSIFALTFSIVSDD